MVKKAIVADQTENDPPTIGVINLARKGSARKSKKAPSAVVI